MFYKHNGKTQLKGKEVYSYFLPLILFIILTSINLLVNTTGDAGDSVTHYLYSYFAFDYPQFFFHHWAKPVFVLLSSPFAQFGFKGIIVFNSLCASLSLYILIRISQLLDIESLFLSLILFLFTPIYFSYGFSGLTEYLFALVLLLGIYFAMRSKNYLAFIIISFLPLIRSEGLLILPVFFVYALSIKEYKLIALLIFGQLLYSIIGGFYYGDFLWVITKIPYSNFGSPYGRGELFDFVHRLNYAIEKPIYILFTIGLIIAFINLFKEGFTNKNKVIIILLAGSFFAVFIGHSIFWFFGIFNSMGLARVLISIIPIVFIFSLIAYIKIFSLIVSKTAKYIGKGLIILTIVLFPFTNRPQGIVYEKDLFVINENELISNSLSPFIKEFYPDYKNRLIYFSHPYIGLDLQLDYFNIKKHRRSASALKDKLKKGDLIIWDDWFSVIEDQVSLNTFSNINELKEVIRFDQTDKDRKIQFVVFEVK